MSFRTALGKAKARNKLAEESARGSSLGFSDTDSSESY